MRVCQHQFSTHFFQMAEKQMFSHGFIVSADASKTEMDMSLTSPWAEAISSKISAKYASFPMSADAEVGLGVCFIVSGLAKAIGLCRYNLELAYIE